MRPAKHHKILAALFLLFACQVARADTIELTEFRAILRNALFIVNETSTSNWIEGSMRGSGRGIKFYDFFRLTLPRAANLALTGVCLESK